jgi:alkanesulfonate monooxygenase SsuD/methylene tetrahydromethanopterin reductase-like flavin-dependent oxidoreductase (luciferase family)
LKYAVSMPNFGEYADPHSIMELARMVEAHGWDGFFLWDHMLWTSPQSMPLYDPYVLLAAMATATERITIAPMITPVPRRRPWKLAREIVTLDHLTRGRLMLGVGIGGDWFGDYSSFGEDPADKTHGTMLDEGLDVLAWLMSGEEFSYEGTHYRVKEVQFLPTPVQRPRIPIIVAGLWPNKKPFRRAARWDGIAPLAPGEDVQLTPQEIRDLLAYIGEHRTSEGPFQVVFGGRTPGKEPEAELAQVAAYAEAGVTWWVENFDWNNPLPQVQERICQGPPRVQAR